ncbi:MAG: DUF1320 family protein [Phycisphaerae bacterium]|nr:DUF1320 family protein [Phycisphaerae bacterium]
MAYVTTTQLSSRLGSTMYGRLTDRVTGTTASATTAQQIVAEAEAEANSYLAVRYATPIDLTVNAELADIMQARVLDLAEYAAWKSSPFVNDMPSRVQDVYRAALAWLRDVADGRVNLPADEPLAGPLVMDDSPRYASSVRRLTADELDGL